MDGILAALLLAAITSAQNTGENVGSLTSGSLGAAALGKDGNLAGMAIGFTLAASILAGGTYTGASLNPSRTLGPDIVGGRLNYVPLYLVGIFGGGPVAGLLHHFVFEDIA